MANLAIGPQQRAAILNLNRRRPLGEGWLRSYVGLPETGPKTQLLGAPEPRVDRDVWSAAYRNRRAW